MACIIHVFASSPALKPFRENNRYAGDASGGHAPAATKVILSWWKTTELLYSSPLFWQEDKGRFTPLCLINVPRTGALLLEGGKASIKCASRDSFVFAVSLPTFDLDFSLPVLGFISTRGVGNSIVLFPTFPCSSSSFFALNVQDMVCCRCLSVRVAVRRRGNYASLNFSPSPIEILVFSSERKRKQELFPVIELDMAEEREEGEGGGLHARGLFWRTGERTFPRREIGAVALETDLFGRSRPRDFRSYLLASLQHNSCCAVSAPVSSVAGPHV